MSTEHWMESPEDHDFPAAQAYLSLLMDPAAAAKIVDALRKTKQIEYHKAKDILRASDLQLLPVDNAHVASDLAKVKAGKKLSPVLLVRGEPLVIGDGYHRVCASYHLDENADIPCRIVVRDSKMSQFDLALLARVAVGFGLAYVFGFERQLRGSPAGDRTFAIVGTASTAVTAVAAHSSPQAIAGVITGVGFIGGAVVLHRQGGLMIFGITTAATIFAVAAIGVVVGYGHLLLGVITAAGLLLTLELPYIPFLRVIDAHTYQGRFRTEHPPAEDTSTPPGDQGPKAPQG